MNRRPAILVLTAVLLTAAQPLLACAVCYGDSESPMSRGLTFAITAMVGIVAVVLTGVVCFFVQAAKKSAALNPAAPDGAGQP